MSLKPSKMNTFQNWTKSFFEKKEITDLIFFGNAQKSNQRRSAYDFNEFSIIFSLFLWKCDLLNVVFKGSIHSYISSCVFPYTSNSMNVALEFRWEYTATRNNEKTWKNDFRIANEHDMHVIGSFSPLPFFHFKTWKIHKNHICHNFTLVCCFENKTLKLVFSWNDFHSSEKPIRHERSAKR